MNLLGLCHFIVRKEFLDYFLVIFEDITAF